jgi:hypothetical protein
VSLFLESFVVVVVVVVGFRQGFLVISALLQEVQLTRQALACERKAAPVVPPPLQPSKVASSPKRRGVMLPQSGILKADCWTNRWSKVTVRASIRSSTMQVIRTALVFVFVCAAVCGALSLFEHSSVKDRLVKQLLK